MASTFKVLGQSNPDATTLTDCYVVPEGKQAVVSSIIVANRGASTTFRIAISVNGDADDPKQYIAYDTAIVLRDIVDFTIGATLSEGDVVRVYATNATLSFNVFGEEIG